MLTYTPVGLDEFMGDDAGNEILPLTPDAAPPAKSLTIPKWVWWTLGGLAVLGVGIVVYKRVKR